MARKQKLLAGTRKPLAPEKAPRSLPERSAQAAAENTIHLNQLLRAGPRLAHHTKLFYCLRWNGLLVEIPRGSTMSRRKALSRQAQQLPRFEMGRKQEPSFLLRRPALRAATVFVPRHHFPPN